MALDSDRYELDPIDEDQGVFRLQPPANVMFPASGSSTSGPPVNVDRDQLGRLARQLRRWVAPRYVPELLRLLGCDRQETELTSAARQLGVEVVETKLLEPTQVYLVASRSLPLFGQEQGEINAVRLIMGEGAEPCAS